MTRHPAVLALFALLALLGLLAAGFARADDGLRDPMQPPGAARAAASAPAATAASGVAPADTAWRPRALIASGGKRWLVQDARRYGVGETLGSARIERIDDDAVWLREAGKLTRMPLFGSVAKRAPSAGTTNPNPAVRKERQS